MPSFHTSQWDVTWPLNGGSIHLATMVGAEEKVQVNLLYGVVVSSRTGVVTRACRVARAIAVFILTNSPTCGRLRALFIIVYALSQPVHSVSLKSGPNVCNIH